MATTHHALDALQRLKGMFVEVPGTCLTVEEAARLCGVDEDRCAALLAALADTGFLVRTRDGRFRPVDASLP